LSTIDFSKNNIICGKAFRKNSLHYLEFFTFCKVYFKSEQNWINDFSEFSRFDIKYLKESSFRQKYNLLFDKYNGLSFNFIFAMKINS
jgi:hypothetical protein